MSSSADIARLVASLIDANLGSLDERRSAALLNFAMRILGSHMPAPPGGSQPMEVARRRLVREGRAADALGAAWLGLGHDAVYSEAHLRDGAAQHAPRALLHALHARLQRRRLDEVLARCRR